MWDQDELRLLRQFMREIGKTRLEMASKDYVGLRANAGGHMVQLRLKVLVPVCPDCWVYEARMQPDIPHVSADNWELDLLLLGFPPDVIQELKEELGEGITEERGPWCYYCHRWLPYWDDEEGCFSQQLEFTDYFGFHEKEGPAISKAMRQQIAQTYGKKCFSCGVDLKADEITIDHIVPRSLGGTGGQINLQVLCSACNNAKSSLLPETVVAVLHFPMRPVPSDAYEGVTW
ncbi:MAG: HNH endonuclease [Chloroflexi bacterium]|nr:HNH endonuclease [Chloroflexota bacterium]